MLNNSENLTENVSVCFGLDRTLSNIVVYTEDMTPCFISFVLVMTSSQPLRAMKEMAASC